MQVKVFIYIIICSMTVISCSPTKYVDDGSYLLNKVEVKTDEERPDVNLSQLKSYVRQKGNSRWFSAMRLPLATYSLSGRDTTKWINRMLRSIGEAPVVFDSVEARKSCEDIRLAMCNLGYLDASVDMIPKVKGTKKVNLLFTVHPGEPYRIRHIDYIVNDTAISRILDVDGDDKRLLRDGMQFNVNELNNERKRITDLLTDVGYYRFHKDYITFHADSIGNSHDIDLSM